MCGLFRQELKKLQKHYTKDTKKIVKSDEYQYALLGFVMPKLALGRPGLTSGKPQLALKKP